MRTEVEWIDVTPFLASRTPPVYALQRPKAHGKPKPWAGQSEVARPGTHWVPKSPAYVTPINWSNTRTGDVVSVPIFSYQTRQPALAALFGLGVELGALVAADLLRQGIRPEVLHLLIGHNCPQLAQGIDCYLGFAFYQP